MSTELHRNQHPSADTAKRHFELRRSEIAAMAEQEAPRLSLQQAVSIALRAVPRLAPLLPRVIELPGIDGRRVAELESYALAAWYADLVLRGAETVSALEPALTEARELRRNLLSDAEALAQRGLVPEASVAEIRAGQGHVDLANDLVSLANLFEGVWAQVQGRTLTDERELARATELGSQLLLLLAQRQVQNTPGHGSASPDLNEQTRLKAFALFLSVYEDARRAVSYLRWHEEDANAITPSLYAQRRKAARAKTEDAPPLPADRSAPPR